MARCGTLMPLVHRLLQAYAHEAARQQVEVRVGELAAQGDLAGAGSTLMSENSSLPGSG
jgi:hypothetical protein